MCASCLLHLGNSIFNTEDEVIEMKSTSSNKLPFLLLVAFLVNFFPCALLYPVDYPVREVAILLFWILAFPSPLGIASLVLVPLMRSESLGYFAFNLFCILGIFAVTLQSFEWARTNSMSRLSLHRLARNCLLFSLLLAMWQGQYPDIWLNTFPAMQSLGEGRGSGFRTEPSLLAPLLALYLTFVLWRLSEPQITRKLRNSLVTEGMLLALLTLYFTRSFSVAIVLFFLLPAFVHKIRYLIFSGIAGAGILSVALASRVSDAFSTGGDFTYLITSAVGSWRNVPDIVILANASSYLLPGNPGDLRNKIHMLIAIWNPDYLWLDSTYSMFSACASTLGIIATAVVFAAGLLFFVYVRRQSVQFQAAWLLLYIANWFILPKYDASGWIALGLLAAFSAALEPATSTHTIPASKLQLSTRAVS